jgi:hypothetical protein
MSHVKSPSIDEFHNAQYIMRNKSQEEKKALEEKEKEKKALLRWADRKMDIFPFAKGVPTEKKLHEHADGVITESKFTPFCFVSPLRSKWIDIQSSAPTSASLSPGILPCVSSNDMDSDVVIGQIVQALGRYGACILDDSSAAFDLTKLRCAMDAANHERSSHAHAVFVPESYPLMAHPLLMSLTDGIIGQQVLRVDLSKYGLQDIVCPPGIFTDEKTIESIPWELNAFAFIDYQKKEKKSKWVSQSTRLF